MHKNSVIFLKKCLEVPQNGANFSQIGPPQSCRPTKHFLKRPMVFGKSSSSKKTRLWGGNFYVAKPNIKTELFKKRSIAKALGNFF